MVFLQILYCKVIFHPSVEFNPQITLLSNVEFNSSYFYFIILYINMALPPSIKEALMNKHTHLNLDARILIETLLNQQHSFKSIARHLGKDCTTISKEVKSHICFEKSGTYGRSFQRLSSSFPSSMFHS